MSLNEVKKIHNYRAPTKDQTTEFTKWITKEEHTTGEFIEKFGPFISLKLLIDESNKSIKGKIVHQRYYKESVKDIKYGIFYKIIYVTQKDNFQELLKTAREMKGIKHIEPKHKDTSFEDAIKLAREAVSERNK